MAEIDKRKIEELKRVIGFDEDGEYRRKSVNIIGDKKQFSVRIPKRFSDILKLDKTKDTFEFILIPESETEFRLEAKLVRG